MSTDAEANIFALLHNTLVRDYPDDARLYATCETLAAQIAEDFGLASPPVPEPADTERELDRLRTCLAVAKRHVDAAATALGSIVPEPAPPPDDHPRLEDFRSVREYADAIIKWGHRHPPSKESRGHRPDCRAKWDRIAADWWQCSCGRNAERRASAVRGAFAPPINPDTHRPIGTIDVQGRAKLPRNSQPSPTSSQPGSSAAAPPERED